MMLDPEMETRQFAVEAKAVTLRGRLSTKGLRMLPDLIPFPGSAALEAASHNTSGGLLLSP